MKILKKILLGFVVIVLLFFLSLAIGIVGHNIAEQLVGILLMGAIAFGVYQAIRAATRSSTPPEPPQGILDGLGVRVPEQKQAPAVPHPGAAFLDDEVARKTEWGPVIDIRDSTTRYYPLWRLAEVRGKGLYYRNRISIILTFLMGFFLTGTGFMLYEKPLNGMCILNFALGAYGIAAGLWLSWNSGAWTPVFSFDSRKMTTRKGSVKFSDIHALQLIVENDGTARGTQIIAVLKDGSRRFIAKQGNIDKARKDAARIAALVGCKVWDIA